MGVGGGRGDGRGPRQVGSSRVKLPAQLVVGNY